MSARTIPEIRDRLLELAIELSCPELTTLANATKRRVGSYTKPRSKPLTKVTAHQIRFYKKTHPDLSHQEIATVFKVNPGRVSEALRGFRDGRKI